MTNKGYIWAAYPGLLCLMAWLCFGDLRTHPASKNLRLLQLAIDVMLPSAEFSAKAMQLALDLRYTTTSNAEIVAKALHNLGAGFLKKKDLATATEAYEQTLRIDPDRFKTLKYLPASSGQRA